MQSDTHIVWSKRLSTAGTYLFLTILLLIVLFPVVWVVGQSFMHEEQILKWPVQLIPTEPTLENFIELFVLRLSRQELSVVRWIFNSLYVTTLSTAGVLLVTSMAGYAFARLRFPGKTVLFFGLGASFLVPGVMLLIPSFMLMRLLGWIDTHHALIWPPLAGFFGVFFMRQFFLAIPSELAEAAVIDGASAFGIYWRVMLPLSRPAVATLGIFTFLFIWNDFTWPLIVLNSNEMRTLPIGLVIFVGEYWSEQGIVMAGAVLDLGAGLAGLHHLPAANHAGSHGDRFWRAVTTSEITAH